MEASEWTPAGAVSAPALVELAVRQPGPFATVYLSTEGAIDNAAQLTGHRWRPLRDELAEQGAPEAPLAAIDDHVRDAHTRGDCLAVVANSSGVLHVEHVRGVQPLDVARWAPLPSLLPIVRWRQDHPAFVAVLADRTGADLLGVRLEGSDIEREVEGAGGPVTKVAPGGWSQRRFQQRAENTWEHNAHLVAEEVAKLAGRIEARAIVVAGDVRAVSLLEDFLPEHLRGLMHQVSGGRMPDGSDERLPGEIEDAVTEVVARQTEALIERFHMERGQDDRAAEGADAVLDALRQARVEVLLIADDNVEDRTAWFGPQPVHVALEPGDLRSLGVDRSDLREARLADVLIRATLGTGAGIRVIPAGAGPKDEIGAILRWS